ncbi:MAG: TusE/DsrC/DsvC family sulfur relay protein [Nitrospirota bacterium]
MRNNYKEGVQDKFDNYGHLLNFEDWSIGVAEHLAKEEGVKMTEGHWEVIFFLREFYEEYSIAPMMIKTLVKAIAKKLGPEKGNKEYLYELFPVGPAQANRIAGLPRPHGDP